MRVDLLVRVGPDVGRQLDASHLLDQLQQPQLLHRLHQAILLAAHQRWRGYVVPLRLTFRSSRLSQLLLLLRLFQFVVLAQLDPSIHCAYLQIRLREFVVDQRVVNVLEMLHFADDLVEVNAESCLVFCLAEAVELVDHSE